VKLKDILSHCDAVTLLEFINDLLPCASEEDLRRLVPRLRKLVPFDYAAAALSRLGPTGSIENSHIINVSYPEEWIEIYASNCYFKIDPIFIENFSRFGLQHWKETYKKHEVPKKFLHHAIEYGLKDGYTHGMKNLRGNTGSLLSLSGDLIESDVRTRVILNIVIPHIHQAIVKVAGPHNLVGEAALKKISHRETEILRWLRDGKDSWEIAAILNISQRTVKFHIHNAMAKLDSASRAQAVAVALERKLISLD